jgi:hypothetical protein
LIAQTNHLYINVQKRKAVPHDASDKFKVHGNYPHFRIGTGLKTAGLKTAGKTNHDTLQ